MAQPTNPPAVIVKDGAPHSMKAWVTETASDFNDMKLMSVTIPEPGPYDVRVRLLAACTNPVDFKRVHFVSAGAAFPGIPGCDGAGVVDAIGPQVTAVKVGDRVQTHCNVMKAFGTFAPYALNHECAVIRIPDTMSFAEGASMPCAAWTAYEALFDRLRVEEGKTIFINGGAGGVGNFAVQMAAAAGVRVITTASTGSVPAVKALGAHHVVDYKKENVADSVLAFTHGVPVDYMYETVSTENTAELALKILKFSGAICCIVGGVPTESLFFKGITVHHGFLGGNHHYTDVEKAKFRRYAEGVLKFVAAKKVKATVSSIIPFDDVLKQLQEQAKGHVHGKVVISMTQPPEAVANPNFTA